MLNIFKYFKDDSFDNVQSSNLYCNGISFENSIYHTLNNLKSIELEVKNSNAWNKNLFKAYISLEKNNNIIVEKYKKNFSSLVTFIFNNGDRCIYNSEVRIHGDLIDHIIEDNGKIITSLDVKLLNGNIESITSFKLFLPGTRNYENEIFITNFLQYLDIYAPESRFINTSVNDNEVDYIFQEKITKEFFEKNNLREGPIIEIYDDWSKNINFENNIWENIFHFSKINNTNFVSRNINNFTSGLNGLVILNKNIRKVNYVEEISEQVTYQLDYSNFSNKNQISNLEVALIALYAEHGLYLNNRKFYYSPLENTLFPIYYDGNSSFLSKDSKNEIEKLLQKSINIDLLKKSADEILNSLLNKNSQLDKLLLELNSSGFEISKKELTILINKFIRNLNFIINFDSNQVYKSEYLLIDKDFQSYTFKIVDNMTNICRNSFCTLIESKDLNTLLKNKNDLYGENYFLVQEDFIIQDTLKYIELNDTTIILKNEPNINIDEINKIIQIDLNNSNQRVVFSGGTLSGWTIFAKHDDDIIATEFRNDNFLLTGCLTFKNITIKEIYIKLSNAFCEDAVNFINSIGTIDYLEIINSSFDGLDIDFSEIIVSNIKVTSAKNDCIDLSYGNYVFLEVYLLDCGDKGISIGEKSNSQINFANIGKSNIAIAVKDSSYAEISNLNSYDNLICLQIFQKKQEFGPSKVLLKNSNCLLEEIILETGSLLIND